MLVRCHVPGTPGTYRAFGDGSVGRLRRPYGWDTLVENLTDPSHLPFSHHNVLGDRRAARALPDRCCGLHREPIHDVGVHWPLAPASAGQCTALCCLPDRSSGTRTMSRVTAWVCEVPEKRT